MFSQPGARRAALGTRNHPSQVRELPQFSARCLAPPARGEREKEVRAFPKKNCLAFCKRHFRLAPRGKGTRTACAPNTNAPWKWPAVAVGASQHSCIAAEASSFSRSRVRRILLRRRFLCMYVLSTTTRRCVCAGHRSGLRPSTR